MAMRTGQRPWSRLAKIVFAAACHLLSSDLAPAVDAFVAPRHSHASPEPTHRRPSTELHDSAFQLMFKKMQPYCKASHILLKGDTEENRARLEEAKAEAGDDVDKFAALAKEMSACSTRNQGGRLGLFNQGDMTKGFDEVCFGEEYEVGKVHGPIKTEFGYHLILITKRDLKN